MMKSVRKKIKNKHDTYYSIELSAIYKKYSVYDILRPPIRRKNKKNVIFSMKSQCYKILLKEILMTEDFHLLDSIKDLFTKGYKTEKRKK